ncbi:MAG: ribonuclease PH, partial [Proteobacteria bacterium]|nr:ribonuclease PH [Pseudomonadota bacterium]
FVAATSVGLWNNELILDLDYEEDCHAELDANFACTGDGKFIEIQATGEAHPFAPEQMTAMMALAAKGCSQLIGLQKQVLGD